MLYDAHGRPLKKVAAPKAEPTIQTTHAENLAARRFLGFLLEDLRYQVGIMAKDTRVSRADFQNSKDAALLLGNYLSAQLKELDRLIKIGEKEEAAAIAEFSALLESRLKEHDEDSGAINDPPASTAIN